MSYRKINMPDFGKKEVSQVQTKYNYSTLVYNTVILLYTIPPKYDYHYESQ